MLETRNRFVANVAEVFGTFLAVKKVESSFLLVEFSTPGAEGAKLNVNGRIFGQTQELLDHLGRDVLRQ